jgi:spermidine/putrescine transport system permease protein
MYTRAYKAAVSIPPLLWVTIFLLIPYAILFCYSFWQVSPLQIIIHTWTLANYRELLSNHIYLEVLFRSMRIASAVTALAL